jgi:hypothetical protein
MELFELSYKIEGTSEKVYKFVISFPTLLWKGLPGATTLTYCTHLSYKENEVLRIWPLELKVLTGLDNEQSIYILCL